MSNFKAYSNYYDLLYKDKNYKAESDYVVSTLKELNPDIKTIIELGCGSGSHANFICQNELELIGIERSQDMANVAKAKNIKGFNTIVADISSYPKLDKEYDAAISLFHVISYLTDNTSLINCFNITHQNLKTGGLFLFDVWFTPAVYSQQPETRVRRLEDENIKVTRIAQSTSNATTNVVDVNFEVMIQDKQTNELTVLNEVHPMRHYSIPEIELLAKQTGFELIKTEEFLTKNKPGKDTWGVCFILKKI